MISVPIPGLRGQLDVEPPLAKILLNLLVILTTTPTVVDYVLICYGEERFVTAAPSSGRERKLRNKDSIARSKFIGLATSGTRVPSTLPATCMDNSNLGSVYL